MTCSSDFCHVSWRLFDVWTWYLGYWFHVAPRLTLSYMEVHQTYITCSNYVALYHEVCLMYEHHTWDTGSMLHQDWPCNVCRCIWPILHAPVILPCIMKTVWCMNIILGILVPRGTRIDRVMYVSLSDLYYMLQWFYLVSWRLFDVRTSYLGYWFQVAPRLTLSYM